MYFVKTRNFYCRKWVKFLLDFALILGAHRGDPYSDGDAKYGLQTRSAVQAWLIWSYFMALSYFSGGWTYIIRPGKQLTGGTYQHVY